MEFQSVNLKELRMDSDNKDPTLEPVESEQPEVFAISRDNHEVQFTRRNFIEMAGAAAAGVVLTSGMSITNQNAALAVTCTVRTDSDEVQVHVGPGRNRGVRAYMPSDQDIPVIGKANDRQGNLWWQIQLPKIEQAWVADEDVTMSGDCTSVGVEATPVVRTAVPSGPAPTATAVANGAAVGTVPAGQTGINFTLNSVTYTLPCGSPIPKGAVCVCNCVSEPAACVCNGVCTCDGNCSCAGESHYWYPN
jgi:hypothetical protein